MKMQMLAVTRLTVNHGFRTSLSEGRIRFHVTLERTVDTSPSKHPTATYSLSFATTHPTEALNIHGDGRDLYLGSMIEKWFGLLLDGEDEETIIRTVLSRLQQHASEGDFPYETRRILLNLCAASVAA